MGRRPNNNKHSKNSVADDQKSAGNIRGLTDGNGGTPTPIEGLTTNRLRQLFPIAWGMIRPYWSSEDRWVARGLLVAVVGLTLGMVHINVLFNRWNNAFFSALQDRDQAAFLYQLLRVSWLIGVFIFFA